MASLGLPFQGTAWYWVEATYGGGASGTTLPLSCKIQDVRIGIGDRHTSLRGIDNAVVCKLLTQPYDYTLHVEYIPQHGDTLLTDVIDRTSQCTLQSLAFCVGANTKCSAAADKSYYYMVGCKPKSVKVNSSTGKEWLVSIDFSVKSTTTGTAYTGGPPTALTGQYLYFNYAGSITKDLAAVAYTVETVDVTVSHKITDHWDHDSLVKQYAIEGDMDVEGSIDITLDEGGSSHFAEVVSQTSFSLVINMGAAGAPKITIPYCQWKTSEIDINVSGEDMRESAPFTGKPSVCTLMGIVT